MLSTHTVFIHSVLYKPEREREINRDKDRDRLIDRDRKKEGGKKTKKSMKKTNMAAVGFEPTPPKRLVP